MNGKVELAKMQIYSNRANFLEEKKKQRSSTLIWI